MESETGGLSTARGTGLIVVLALAAFAYVTMVLQFSPLLTEISDEFQVSESTVGQISTAGGLVSTVTSLLAAPFMQRFSRRRWITVELGLLGIAAMTMATAPSFTVLMIGRVMAGLAGGALLANCYTAVSDYVTDRHQRNQAIAVVASGTTMAVVAGLPVVTLIEDAASWRWASGSVAIALLVVMVAAAVIIPAATPQMPASKSQRRAGSRQVIAHRPTAWLLGVMVLLFISYFGWVTYFGAYFEHDFEGTAGRLGTLFLVGGLSELAANTFVPWLTRRFSVFALTMAGAIGVSATLLGSGSVFSTSASLFVAISLLHIFTSFMYIGTNTLLLDSQLGNYGAVMAMTSAATGFGGATGALVAGVALALFDEYETAYVLLGVLMTVTVGLLILSRRVSDRSSA